MDHLIYILLFLTGIVGGAINAVAGGATLFTFPAMILAGLPPIVANASSSVALTPGHLFAVVAERKHLPAPTLSFWLSIGIAVVGGITGAYLLFITTEKLFARIVPLLIGLATLIFAFGKPLQDYFKGTSSVRDTPSVRTSLMFPVSVYGGYFGAGMGVVLLAAFSLTSGWHFRTANAMKNLLGVCANWAAIAMFLYTSLINWPATLTMLAGASVGGWLGVKVLAHLPSPVIRYIVITMGTLMTVSYIWKYWM
jgi:uncharacterized protein